MRKKPPFYRFHNTEAQAMRFDLMTVSEMCRATGISRPRIEAWLHKMHRTPVAFNGASEALHMRSTLELLRDCAAADPSDNVMAP